MNGRGRYMTGIKKKVLNVIVLLIMVNGLCACSDNADNSMRVDEGSNEYARVCEFVEYFNDPVIGFFDETEYASVIMFATEKLKNQESEWVKLSDSGEYYVISVNDLKSYIDQYFENTEEIVKTIPTKQTSTGQTLRVGERVVFYDDPYADNHPMHVTEIRKDDSYYYVECIFPEYQPAYASVSEFSLAPRIFVVSYRNDELRLCGVRKEIEQ